MEHAISFLSYLLFSLSFILFLLKILKLGKKSKVTGKTLNLPPGPWKLPLVGNLHHLIGFLPHQRLRDLAQKYGPIMYLQIGEVSTIVVSSPEVAKEVLKTYDIIFAQRPHQDGADIICYGSTDIASAPYGGYWKQLRRICSQELLSSKRVRSFQSTREKEMRNLIRYISTNTGSCVNLSEKVASMISDITVRAAFGKKCKDQEEFISHIKKLVAITQDAIILDMFSSQKWLHRITGARSKLEEMHRKFDIIFENIIREALEKTDEGEAEGFLSVLLKLKESETLEYPLTMDNIKAVIFDMFAAGSDTTIAVIEWAFSEMLKNPGAMIKAQEEVRKVFGSKGYTDETALQELKFLKAVIKESMRLHPAVPLLLPRECRETCEIKGYTIPVGNQVIVNAWAIGRDPESWNEAGKFYPERFMDCAIDYKGSNTKFIPFGAGRRICPGMLFGTANVELCLAQLLYYFNWKLPDGTEENLDMSESLGVVLKRKTDLILVPISYNPVPVS